MDAVRRDQWRSRLTSNSPCLKRQKLATLDLRLYAINKLRAGLCKLLALDTGCWEQVSFKGDALAAVERIPGISKIARRSDFPHAGPLEHSAGACLVFERKPLQLFWSYKQPWRAEQHLSKWIRSAMRSKLEPFKNFAQMLRTHLDGILPWTTIRLSNGAVEGMNNKIKSISHRSFGFRTARRTSSPPSTIAAHVSRCRPCA